MVLVKKAIFPTSVLLGNIGQENVFDDILKRKNAFLGYKNKKFKKSKNWHFSTGGNPWVWSKKAIFPTSVFLDNIAKENVFYDILKRKKAFLGYKNKKFMGHKPSYLNSFSSESTSAQIPHPLCT